MVELVIALVVSSLLMSVAMPSFMAQLRQARRVDAVDACNQATQAQQRWLAKHGRYATALDAELKLSPESANGFYTLALASVSSTGYVLSATAVPAKSQASDGDCQVLTLAVSGGQEVRSPAACWGPQPPGSH